MFKLLRPIRNLIGAGILVVLTGASVALAKLLPDFWFSFYTDFSRKAMRVLGVAFGWTPFPLWEVLLVLLILYVPVGLIVSIRKRRVLGWLTALLEGLCLLVFLFVGLWGLNHFAPPLNEQLGLEVRPYTESELKKAARYYAQQASSEARLVERDGNGDVILPDFSELNTLAVAGYEALGAECPRLADPVGCQASAGQRGLCLHGHHRRLRLPDRGALGQHGCLHAGTALYGLPRAGSQPCRGRGGRGELLRLAGLPGLRQPPAALLRQL